MVDVKFILNIFIKCSARGPQRVGGLSRSPTFAQRYCLLDKTNVLVY